MGWQDWKDTAIKTAREHIVLGLFGLITLLLLVIYRAVPSSAWDTISGLVPKRVLWALIALELIVIGLQSALALDNWRKKRTPVKPLTKFNIHWDSDFDPLCPLCDVHLPMIERDEISTIGPYEIFGCPKCRTQFRLFDDDGNRVLLAAAKVHLRAMIPAKRK